MHSSSMTVKGMISRKSQFQPLNSTALTLANYSQIFHSTKAVNAIYKTKKEALLKTTKTESKNILNFQ